ncbi:MAG: hypothetical protein HWE16_11535 [Gammaproteobacteria bacterium]|nr:hypothetical protein [Gammaproteobacteria bacterium]
METASNFFANNILLLGILIVAGLVIAVVFAALKHALVRQLESKVDELKQVVEKNTKNIADKQRLLDAKTEAHDELKVSLQDLSSRHTELRHNFNDSQKSLSNTQANFEKTQQDYLNSMQTIANNQKEYELELQAQKNSYEQTMLDIQKEADKKVESFQENYLAEFEHLKKSHKRLVQANQTMSKTADNLRSERDFYRTEFQTLRNFLHESQMDKAKKLVDEHAEKLAETNKVIKLSGNPNDS